MFRRFHVFLQQADPGGGGDVTKVTPPVETKLEKTGWTSAVTDDIFKEHGEELLKHENINSVITDYYSQKEKLSSAIIKPGEKASEEEVKAYKEKMGIPLKAEDYEFGELPEGVEKSEEFDKWLKDKSLELGLNKEQTKEFHKELKSLEAAGLKDQNAAKEKAKADTEKTMKIEYGKDYDSVMAKVVRILDLGGADFKASLEKTGLGSDPGMVKVLAKLGEMISEDTLDHHRGGTEPVGSDPADILYPKQGKK